MKNENRQMMKRSANVCRSLEKNIVINIPRMLGEKTKQQHAVNGFSRNKINQVFCEIEIEI